MAYRLGEPGKRRVVLISTMHGDEQDTRQILRALTKGRAIRGIDLWVVPTYNPDGMARHTRKNARGVDLNRNFPYRWRDLDGSYESGPRPKSEPETRAMMRFLRDVRPSRILSFHQPLHGVDTDTKNKRFARRVARKLRPSGEAVRLRRRLPRHHDDVVQPRTSTAPRSRSSTAPARRSG